MTTEEKAKAYDEALERARKIHNEILDNEILGFPDQIREIFPELRESEDERIRKWLIDYFGKVGGKAWIHREFTCEQILAWLEKQKEHKWSPSEGEMGVLYKLCYISNQITDEDDTELTRLYQDLKREYFNGHSFENMFPSEKRKEQKPISFNEPHNPDEYEVVMEGNAIDLKRKEQKPIEDVAKDITENKEAATKFLKSAGIMDENGELAEMYRSEQKPTISDEAIRDGIVHFGITQYQIDNWLKKHINIVEQKPVEIDEYKIIKKHITEDSISSEVNKRLKECGWYVTDEKPAEWSEEDKRAINDAIVSLSEIANGEIPHLLPSILLEVVERLKSLCPQSKQEWSEEDEDAIQQAILALEDRYDEYEPNLCFLGYKLPFNKAAERLKSLRPQSHWKPSEEQMNCLCAAVDAAIRKHNESVSGYKPARILKSLYEQLKKLT